MYVFHSDPIVDTSSTHSNNGKVRQLENIPSNPAVPSGPASQTDGWTSSHDMGISPNPFIYDEHHMEHLSAHDDMRNFVHEAFSPTFDWSNGFWTGYKEHRNTSSAVETSKMDINPSRW